MIVQLEKAVESYCLFYLSKRLNGPIGSYIDYFSLCLCEIFVNFQHLVQNVNLKKPNRFQSKIYFDRSIAANQKYHLLVCGRDHLTITMYMCPLFLKLSSV